VVFADSHQNLCSHLIILIHHLIRYRLIEPFGPRPLVLGSKLRKHLGNVSAHNVSVDSVILKQPVCLLRLGLAKTVDSTDCMSLRVEVEGGFYEDDDITAVV
jgi:hypothetical protein